MCGIAGFLGDHPARLLTDFATRLAHRGPDGEGVWSDLDHGVGLAHRRLGIIDLSAAASQPMSAVEGRYRIVFNGEIYNFRSLQKELGAYDYNHASDTAVLAPLYDRYGPAMLQRLEGMFAFALWDRARRELFLARDHAGLKPLYYATTPKGLVFASELKALIGVDGIDADPDAAALADYLTLLWSPGERTPLRGIKKLPPGHWMRARRAAGDVRVAIDRWHAPPQAPIENGVPRYDEGLRPRRLLTLLDDVVAEQCASDVPVGAFLSGGLDSSALVASMVANAERGRGPRPAMTYCIGFAGAGMRAEGFDDDLTYAKIVAEQLKAPLTPMLVEEATVLAGLPGLARMLDEPTADPAALFVRDICARAREDGVTVLLSGAGGDDVMTGYRRHLTARLRQQLACGRGLASSAAEAGSGCRLLSPAQRRRAAQLAELLRGDDEAFLQRAFRANSDSDAWRLLRPDLRERLAEDANDALTRAMRESAGQDLVDRLLHMERAGFLPDHNLNYCDKASMSVGVEVRAPFTDRRVLDFMAGVSPGRKLRGWRLKAFLKEAMASRLPRQVIHRGKTGFGAPIRGWLIGSGRELVEDALLGDRASDWFDRAAVEELWRRTSARDADGAYSILAACMCVWWRESVLGA
jgi:asparagine synthase (glutamine-hydrolysing)